MAGRILYDTFNKKKTAKLSFKMDRNCMTELFLDFFQFFCVYRTTSNYFAQLENWTIMYYYNVVILCSSAFFIINILNLLFYYKRNSELTYLPLMRVYHPPNIWLTIIYIEDESWIPAGRNFFAKKYSLVSLIYFVPRKSWARILKNKKYSI